MYGGFGPGSTEQYVFATNDVNDNVPLLNSIELKMMIGACTVVHSRRLASADDNCTPPGVTKIEKAEINQHSGTAFFGYKASYATNYVCELFYKNRMVHRSACGEGRAYHGLVHPGKYFFLVWGANAAGIAPKATVYGFEIR
jgi:hypothetical protein